MTLPEACAGGFSAHAELCAGCPPELLRQGRKHFTEPRQATAWEHVTMVTETRGYGAAATHVTRACGPTVRATVYPAGPGSAPRIRDTSARNTSQYGISWQLNLERK
ncbi:hypothetical protein [Dictyobacter formicarum]|uniref:Uncharacterized protein n=1 Tax=Dictyobacter formicarum TaxID=2778368 RepID=A0ABQ3VQU4_9CHLR|nr:hypothetical protein [Dictyobacter formicarum]GHO88185.1 hypothetical protein KSZ_61910 [Dictyobacter formicarum]